MISLPFEIPPSFMESLSLFKTSFLVFFTKKG